MIARARRDYAIGNLLVEEKILSENFNRTLLH